MYLDTNWGDDKNDDSGNWNNVRRNWKMSNRLGQSNFLDYRGDAKPQQANWIRGAIKVISAALESKAVHNFFKFIPRGMLIAPADEFTTNDPMDPLRTKRPTKPLKRRIYT